MFTTFALELLAFLTRLTAPPRHAPLPPRSAFAAWAERRGFVRDASGRRYVGRLAGCVTCVEPGVGRANAIDVVVVLPLRVDAPVTLTAATRPRDEVERALAGVFDVEQVRSCLASITLLSGGVHLAFAAQASPPAVELATTLVAGAVARPIRCGARA